MSIQGLSHLTFVVRDLDRMSLFLCEGLGAEQVYDSGAATYSLSPERFYLLGGLWIAAMAGEPTATRGYRHVAFAVDAQDLPDCEMRLRRIGAEILPSRSRDPAEGRSLYVYDFDNHLFELHTGDLETRLAHYAAGAGRAEGAAG